MPSFSQMTQAGANDPLGGLGARKPRADEIAKRDAEITAKQAAERRAHDFEKVVHATEKQMRGEALGRASGSAPLGNSGNSGAGQKLDERGYLVQAADRIWPDDFKREIEDLGCDLLKVFCDHHDTQIHEALIFSGAGRTGVSPRDYLAGLKKDRYVRSGEKVWFISAYDNGNRVFYYRKVTPKAS